MYMLKNNSPNIDHWSTPALTGNQHGYLTKPAETCCSRAFKCICCKNTHVYVHSKWMYMYVSILYFQNHDPHKNVHINENTYIKIMMIIVKHQRQQIANYGKNNVRNKIGITLDQAGSP